MDILPDTLYLNLLKTHTMPRLRYYRFTLASGIHGYVLAPTAFLASLKASAAGYWFRPCVLVPMRHTFRPPETTAVVID